ncbi:LuxR C-terminal-related transcriptional regulator [Neolewinella lacunae]|uniref:Response regulator transcription factor n=1 Tax=Neolewinella lacunae TaxID=1517758 RepID=A0A923PF29_9BACT|nr:LuxR C-terminal-related transcriptional regulator [Neolewinella lacunae]MBC6992948.1 response regulator transcription factor [Neolewinella lacunae]MDN3633688.1 LuxR C-terminal-related transcriptional regulator [Neolewinella lacunae]
MQQPDPFISPTDGLEVSPNSLWRILELQTFARENRRRFASLSEREVEILTLICQGLTNEEIASKIFRSVNTVRTHRNNIWRQLEIKSVVEALRWGQAFDLV